MSKYQLIYFSIRGKAEATRLLFQDNGIDYEDVNCGTNWPAEWKSKLVFGQAPALQDGDLLLVQSNAILRYLARKHDLYGSSNVEAAFIDIVVDGVEDLRMKYAKMIYSNYDAGKDPYVAELSAQLTPFENLLTKNGNAKDGFTVGNKKSLSDYALFDILDVHLVLAPKCLDAFPALSAFYKAVQSRPGIAAYRETEIFKSRPCNGNGKQ